MSKMSQLHAESAPDRADAAEREASYLRAENARLRSIIDAITGPPMTAEEAEKALADFPLDDDDRAAMARIDIKAIIAYATDPDNMSPEEAVRRMIEAAKACPGFDPRTLAGAVSWLEKRREF